MAKCLLNLAKGFLGQFVWGYEFRVVAITASSVVDLGTDQTHSDTSMCIVIHEVAADCLLSGWTPCCRVERIGTTTRPSVWALLATNPKRNSKHSGRGVCSD